MFWKNNFKRKIKKFEKEKKYWDLLVYCNDLLQKNPKNVYGIRGKIFALKKQGKIKQSQEFCEQVMEMFPYDPDVVSCIAEVKKEYETR